MTCPVIEKSSGGRDRAAVPESLELFLVEAALGRTKERLGEHFGERLREMRLFGSLARGTAGPDSDVDVLVVRGRVRDSLERIATMDAVLDVGLDSDVLLQPLVLGEDELARHRRCETALARALDAEGIVL